MMDHEGKQREWTDEELDEMQGYAMSQLGYDKKWWVASDAIGALRIREVKLRAELEGKDRRLALLEKVAEKAKEVSDHLFPQVIQDAFYVNGLDVRNLRIALRALEGK